MTEGVYVCVQDINGDHLVDIVMHTSDFNEVKKTNVVFLATYLNTGEGFCVASESADARTWRLEHGDDPARPNCTYT